MINMDEDKKSASNGGKIGAGLGAVAGAATTFMSNPLGRFAVLQARTEAATNIQNFFFNTFKNYSLSQSVRHAFETVTNVLIAYPAILPIVGGIITAGVGALVGRKISKAKLKHKSLNPKEKQNTI